MMKSPEYLKGKQCIEELIDSIEMMVHEGKHGFYSEYEEMQYDGWFSKKTLAEFRKSIKLLKKVDVYLDCMYGLVEADEEYFCTTQEQELFHKKLREKCQGVKEETLPCVRPSETLTKEL